MFLCLLLVCNDCFIVSLSSVSSCCLVVLVGCCVVVVRAVSVAVVVVVVVVCNVCGFPRTGAQAI